MIELFGASLIICSCAGFGFLLAYRSRKEEQSLYQLITVLDYMECELQYHLTPLPELCRQASHECTGIIHNVFFCFTQELEAQITPEVSFCMEAAMKNAGSIPTITLRCLRLLGMSLGRFDLSGQLSGLEAVRKVCRTEMAHLSENREQRLQNYKTLSICTGAALAILFI